jgi:hypothetical protein
MFGFEKLHQLAELGTDGRPHHDHPVAGADLGMGDGAGLNGHDKLQPDEIGGSEARDGTGSQGPRLRRDKGDVSICGD